MSRQKKSIFTTMPTEDEHKIIHDLFSDSIDSQNIKFNSQTLPSNARWMSDTIVLSSQLLQPDTRNPIEVVFGGVYLRDALELSFAAASRFRYITFFETIFFYVAVHNIIGGFVFPQ